MAATEFHKVAVLTVCPSQPYNNDDTNSRIIDSPLKLLTQNRRLR
jgi:hypothetical protein